MPDFYHDLSKQDPIQRILSPTDYYETYRAPLGQKTDIGIF